MNEVKWNEHTCFDFDWSSHILRKNQRFYLFYWHLKKWIVRWWLQFRWLFVFVGLLLLLLLFVNQQMRTTNAREWTCRIPILIICRAWLFLSSPCFIYSRKRVSLMIMYCSGRRRSVAQSSFSLSERSSIWGLDEISNKLGSRTARNDGKVNSFVRKTNQLICWWKENKKWLFRKNEHLLRSAAVFFIPFLPGPFLSRPSEYPKVLSGLAKRFSAARSCTNTKYILEDNVLNICC